MPTCRPHSILLLAIALTLPLLFGCDRRGNGADPDHADTPESSAQIGCVNCHSMQLDDAHQLACQTCHHGDNSADSTEAVHSNLTWLPGHPLNMSDTCGRCHPQQTASAAKSSHFTLANSVNLVRKAFGATAPLPSLTDIPVEEPPTTALALADDMLRRRCLRCHLYYQGDPYPQTEHGTGCAACHLAFADNAMQSHAFIRFPHDEQCLQCHHGNRVGSDYHGRFERDFSQEFRTPYRADELYPRPYGIEFHQLQPDIHQQAGLACIDCHTGAELMGSAHQGLTPRFTCESCHDWRPGDPPPAPNLVARDQQLILITRHDQRQRVVPLMQHPAHRQYQDQATCVACHAQWSFNDQGTHLLRQDTDDYEPWSFLTVQGSIEVEAQLINNLYGEEFSDPVMVDKLSGEQRPGLWFRGYEQRRWETMQLCRDQRGRITVCRPSLDLHLSYVNSDEEVIFDAVTPTPATRTLRPYTPHTIGKAGSFFKQRLSERPPSLEKQDQP